MTRDRIATFSDLRPILDEALRHGGGVYTLPTSGGAVNWRQRCYKFMKAYAAMNAFSPYEVLTFPRLIPGSCDVVIAIKKPVGHFTPAGPYTPLPAAEDPLEAAAQDFVNRLGIGDTL